MLNSIVVLTDQGFLWLNLNEINSIEVTVEKLIIQYKNGTLSTVPDKNVVEQVRATMKKQWESQKNDRTE